ncbi:unnamed protein product [Boreogadus saida]
MLPSAGKPWFLNNFDSVHGFLAGYLRQRPYAKLHQSHMAQVLVCRYAAQLWGQAQGPACFQLPRHAAHCAQNWRKGEGTRSTLNETRGVHISAEAILS